jgi:glycosyltransferase involved in cell wall biosynthesis
MGKADLVILVRPAHPALPEHIQQKCMIVPAYIPPFATKPLPKELLEIFSSGKILFAHCYQKKNEALLIDGKDLYGFDLIFEAIEKLESKISLSEHVLLLADPADTMKEFYREKMREVSDKTGIRIVYWTKEFDFSSALKYCSLLVRATRSDGDAISVREALHAGVPVLASDCVERPEGVRTFFNGDPESLAKNLLEMLNNSKPQVILQKDYSAEIFKIYRNI